MGFVFRASGRKSFGKLSGARRILTERVPADLADTFHIAYVLVVFVNDPRELFNQRLSLGQECIVPANKMLSTAIAAVQLDFSLQPGKYKFVLLNFVT